MSRALPGPGIVQNKVTISLMGPLFVVLLILKMTGTVTWSWWWITAPLWIPFAFAGVILAAFLFIGLIAAIAVQIFNR